MSSTPMYTQPAHRTEEELEDEFDIDLRVIGVETTGWFGDPPAPSDPGSTCELSCPESCGFSSCCVGD